MQSGWLTRGLMLVVLTAPALAMAQGEDAADEATEARAAIPYTDDGADTCLRCHDEDSDFPVLGILKTRHGHRGDPGAPFGPQGLQCESCHGPGGEHGGRVRRGQDRPPIPHDFESHTPDAVAAENGICLDCHQRGGVAHWASSVHQESDLACTSCHQIHVPEDPVLDARQQPEICYDCHQEQRADSYKASSHPVRFGEMACTDCHQPHASLNEDSLVRTTVNDTCYTCHAEKRGPFLWEHPPATEDCTNCHRPHGSNHPAMLTMRQPLLCQQCHSRAGHPSLALDGDNLPGEGGNFSALLLSRGCGNCHSQVHGSNHPSGVNLTR